MALPEFSLRQLLEAGAHFGHNTHRWNPKMDRYIFGKRNNVHIIDLAQTVPLLHQALKTVSDTVANGGRVLFVGTKRQASDPIAEAARKSAQYYVNHRWLGGTLTNWNTISASIKRLRKLEETLAGAEAEHLTKKERLMLSREHDKLERALGGIKDMGGTPDLMFVIDTNKEKNAVDEARRLKIPVVAVLDTNCDPDDVNFPVPGNDDASRAISLYCDLIAKAALDGIARQQGSSGIDIGALAETPAEEALAEAPAVPLFTAPAGEGDDLTQIKGIGPVAKGQLNEQGITTFAQIAALSDEDVARIDANMPFSADQISDWRGQAREMANA
ncbi:MAG: 30S ribosomal protein S2 [Nitratireductor sp.]|nr:30S ribosomal protein S2 [Nitratireductor sp.]